MWHLKRRLDVLHALIPSETPEEVVTENHLVIALILLETPEVLLVDSHTVQEPIPSETPEVLSAVILFPVAQTHLVLSAASCW